MMVTRRSFKMRLRRLMSTATTPFAWKDVYYTAQQHPKQTLNLAIPTMQFARRRLPTCVFVHGGSWQRGDKAGLFNDGIEQAFVRAGCIGVSLNYRLSPEVKHPEHTRDVAMAMKWLMENIEKYGGDPSGFVLIGHSAGAHLVMQLLANPDYLRECGVDEPVSRVVRGAVGISGVYNVVRIANASFYGPLVVNPAFGERTDQWREGSIVSVLARQGDASPLYKMPTMLLTAEEDFHFEEDANELESWLVEGGNATVSRGVIPGKNHFTIIRDLTAEPNDLTMERIREFLRSLPQTTDSTRNKP